MLNLNSTKQGTVAPKRAVVFMFCCGALSLNHSWNCLVQYVINVFSTLLRCDFFPPELLDTIHQFLLVAWLHLWFQEELEFMLQVFYRVEICTLWKDMPPVDIFSLKIQVFVGWCPTNVFDRVADGTLVTKNDVVKSIATLCDVLSILQSLYFVGFAYHLTVSIPLKHPALLLARSSDCGRTHCNATFCQRLLDLSARHLIIASH